MNLTEHFTLEEFTDSLTAKYNRIDNMPDEEQKGNLIKLCKFILEPAREKAGLITISSGFRSRRLNKLVGGASGSQHTTGCAADLHIKNMEYGKKLFAILRENPHVDQLLYEHNGNGVRWIHVSYSDIPRHYINENYKA